MFLLIYASLKVHYYLTGTEPMNKKKGSWYTSSAIQSITNNYESFILESADIDHQGLYLYDDKIYALVPNLSPSLEKELVERYEKIRVLGLPRPEFCSVVDQNAERLLLSDTWKKTCLHGYPFTAPEAENELNIHLPEKYHPFQFDFKLATNIFELKLRFQPNEDETNELRVFLANLGYDNYELIVKVDNSIPEYLEKDNTIREILGHDPNDLLLKAKSFLPKTYPKVVLDKYQEDQDFWVDNRTKVFSDLEFSQSDFIPKSFLNSTSCFIDASVFSRQNIREYLALYRTVIIALPFNDSPKLSVDFYQMFSLNSFELQELVRRQRLKFTITQNLERYPIELITTILEVDPSAILFPRTLASSTIIGIRNRSGVLGHTLTTEEQFHFLRTLKQEGSEATLRLARAVSCTWQGMEYIVNKLGPTGVSYVGMGQFMSNIHAPEQTTMLGWLTASYEYSLGLGAHYFPYDNPDYPELFKAFEYIGGCYAGFQSKSTTLKEAKLGMLLNKVFSINNDMDVLELDRVFSGKEIPFATDILESFSNLSEEELSLKLMELRTEIGKLEDNQRRLSKWDITGFLGGSAALAFNQPFVSILVWGMIVAPRLLSSSQPHLNVFDKLSAINNRTSRDVVLIKRARDNVSREVS